MTRESFIENYNSFDELYDFASDNSLYDIFDDYFTQDSLDEYVNERIADMTRYESWEEVRDYLNSIPEGADWYRMDQYDGEFYAVDGNDCDDIKSQILDALDEDDFWDEEEEVSDDEDEFIDDIDDYAEEIDFSAIIAENKVMFA